LRDLLDGEKAQFAAQSVTAPETALERQSRLRERARQLREKRESERLAFVEQKYEQQFRSEPHQQLSLAGRRFASDTIVPIVWERALHIKDQLHTPTIVEVSKVK